MRMSCNGCRVLRKGCSEDCTLRPCLQWIKTPESQANATVFLAKFYGRAGLVNLINAGPEHLRPEVFKSLLYEACGRIINPIYGSVGLMWSGNWKRVQEAVDSVLEGSPIMQQIPTSNGGGGSDNQQEDQGRRHPIMPIKGSDIRHLSKVSSAVPAVIHHRIRTRNSRFKRPCSSSITTTNNNVNVGGDSILTTHEHDELMMMEPIKFSITGWVDSDDHHQQQQKQQQEMMMMMMMKRAQSQDSFSVETVEPSLVMKNQNHQFVIKSETPMTLSDDDHDQIINNSKDDHDEIGLELTLGLNPMRCAAEMSTIAAAAAPAGGTFNLDVV